MSTLQEQEVEIEQLRAKVKALEDQEEALLAKVIDLEYASVKLNDTNATLLKENAQLGERIQDLEDEIGDMDQDRMNMNDDNLHLRQSLRMKEG